MNAATDAYAVLGVRPDASAAEIRAAYLTQVRKVRVCSQYHPDKCSADTPHATRIIAAYETLSEPGQRAAYDEQCATCRAKEAPPRIASTVDLDDLEAHEGPPLTFTYPCRCGQQFALAASALSQGTDLVQCSGCSEVIRIETSGILS